MTVTVKCSRCQRDMVLEMEPCEIEIAEKLARLTVCNACKARQIARSNRPFSYNRRTKIDDEDANYRSTHPDP